jgi:hypothetical protein
VVTSRGSSPANRSRPQSGYALLFAIFLSATLFLLAFAAAPNILHQGRREREQQLIWRGNQYVRGIRLYFQKNGRFPQNKEELVKGTLGVHFVRKEFTDPVNTAGEDWRIIYVAPSGQLTGSVRYRSLQEMAAALGGAQNSASLAALFGGPGAGRGGAPPAAQPGAGPGRGIGPAAPPGGLQEPGAGRGAAAEVPEPGGAQPLGPLGQPTEQALLEAVDGPVLGASMIGIASKVKRTSLLVYQGRDSYFDWEFIWNPLLGGVGAAPGVQEPGAGGAAAPGRIGPGQPGATGEPGGQAPVQLPEP